MRGLITESKSSTHSLVKKFLFLNSDKYKVQCSLHAPHHWVIVKQGQKNIVIRLNVKLIMSHSNVEVSRLCRRVWGWNQRQRINSFAFDSTLILCMNFYHVKVQKLSLAVCCSCMLMKGVVYSIQTLNVIVYIVDKNKYYHLYGYAYRWPLPDEYFFTFT